MFDRLVGRARARSGEARAPHLSFGSWERLPIGSVVQVCHPDWRGIRTLTYSFGTPVVECDDLARWAAELTQQLVARRPLCVVIQGWPPGSDELVRNLSSRGIKVKCVLHSSTVQHSGSPIEAISVDEVLRLAADGELAQVGMAKEGLAEAFSAIGYPVAYVPNRKPRLPASSRVDLGPGFHVGIFSDPYWRKNVTTQILAAGMIEDVVVHVMGKPQNRYLDRIRVVEHGVLPYDEFIGLLGSVDLNLYVSLSECHPSLPMESFMMGVPCLVSRTSAVFRSDSTLWELATVELHDNPQAIYDSAMTLYERRDEAIERALQWIESADAEGQARWADFVADA